MREENVRWGITPPRYSGAEILFSKIIVVALVGTDVIGAEEFDLDGFSKPIPIVDVEYNTDKMKEFSSIVTKEYLSNDMTNITSNMRSSWTFETKEEAYVQKMILLDYLGDYFKKSQEQASVIFKNKIPSDITEKLNVQLDKYPEFML